jgi:Delta7-sterol 5-desaturase
LTSLSSLQTLVWAIDWALVWELCWHSFVFFVTTALGYWITAGSLYWFLYLRRSSRFAFSTVAFGPIWSSIRSDVVLSMWSTGIFAVCASVMTSFYQLGYTRLYWDVAQYGWAYLGFSLVFVLFLQDTYFYFTHRLSHHPKGFQWLHQGHHHSKNPTPWTAFAFDPAEAMIQSIYLMVAVWLIPMHVSVLIAVVVVMSLGALVHHFGVRLFADSAFGRWLGGWMVGCTHHWLHHRKYSVHYGLYFTFWDRLLGTQYEGYAEVLKPRTAPGAGKEATRSPVTALTNIVLPEVDKSVASSVNAVDGSAKTAWPLSTEPLEPLSK